MTVSILSHPRTTIRYCRGVGGGAGDPQFIVSNRYTEGSQFGQLKMFLEFN